MGRFIGYRHLYDAPFYWVQITKVVMLLFFSFKLTFNLGFSLRQITLDQETWLSFRGAEMIAIMKGLSLLFDLKRPSSKNDEIKYETKANIGLIDYLSYMLSASTGIVGPWVGYEQHKSGFANKRNDKTVNMFNNYLVYE